MTNLEPIRTLPAEELAKLPIPIHTKYLRIVTSMKNPKYHMKAQKCQVKISEK